MGASTVSGSARRFALLVAVVFVSVVGLAGGAGGVARAALPDAAPALSADQLAQLKAVTSWDFEYTGSSSAVYTGGGGAVTSLDYPYAFLS